MRRALAALVATSVGLIVACGSEASVTDAPPPAAQSVPAPTAPVQPAATITPQNEPAADQLSGPRATVTAWFAEHERPYKRLYSRHLISAYWDAGNTPGVNSLGWNGETEQLSFHVLTETSKTLVEKQAASIGIPLAMLSIEVPVQATIDSPMVMTYSEPGIRLSLEVPESIVIGEPATFQITLENISDQGIDIGIGNPPSVDVVILTIDGKQIWRHQPPLRVGTGQSMTLDVDHKSRIAIPWDLTDDDGFALKPGQYLVRGMANISENGIGQYVPINLATAAIPFTLTAAP